MEFIFPTRLYIFWMEEMSHILNLMLKILVNSMTLLTFIKFNITDWGFFLFFQNTPQINFKPEKRDTVSYLSANT